MIAAISIVVPILVIVAGILAVAIWKHGYAYGQRDLARRVVEEDVRRERARAG